MRGPGAVGGLPCSFGVRRCGTIIRAKFKSWASVADRRRAAQPASSVTGRLPATLAWLPGPGLYLRTNRPARSQCRAGAGRTTDDKPRHTIVTNIPPGVSRLATLLAASEDGDALPGQRGWDLENSTTVRGWGTSRRRGSYTRHASVRPGLLHLAARGAGLDPQQRPLLGTMSVRACRRIDRVRTGVLVLFWVRRQRGRGLPRRATSAVVCVSGGSISGQPSQSAASSAGAAAQALHATARRMLAPLARQKRLMHCRRSHRPSRQARTGRTTAPASRRGGTGRARTPLAPGLSDAIDTAMRCARVIVPSSATDGASSLTA